MCWPRGPRRSDGWWPCAPRFPQCTPATSTRPPSGRQRMQWIAVGAVLGERGHPDSGDAQSAGGVAGPGRRSRCRRHRAGGTGPALCGQPAPCPARRPPACELALDSRLHRRGVGDLPHRGPRTRQDPDRDDRPRGARLVDRRRRHRSRWLHPRPGPFRAHGRPVSSTAPAKPPTRWCVLSGAD